MFCNVLYLFVHVMLCCTNPIFNCSVIQPHVDITSPLLLFNNSPQISGTDLTAYYNLTGCARVTCEVSNQEDCKSICVYIIRT